MQRIVLPALLMLVCATPGVAQKAGNHDGSYPKYELFAGYLDSGEFPYNEFRFGNGAGQFSVPSDFGTRRGLEVSFARNLTRHFGFKGEFSAQFHRDEFTVNACVQTPCVPVVQNAELSPRLFNFLGGPEIKARNHTRFTPFAHALFGVAHTTATFKTSGAAINLSLNITETGFSTAFGGGLDVRIARRFSFRTVTDFNPKWVGRDDSGVRQVQKDWRASVGILIH